MQGRQCQRSVNWRKNYEDPAFRCKDSSTIGAPDDVLRWSHCELPDRRHLHRFVQPPVRPGPEGGEGERLRSADGPDRQRSPVASHRQQQGPQFLVGARQSRHPPDRSQDGRQPAGRLCRPPRRRLCLGGTPADRGASANRRRPDRRGARARGGSRPAGDVRFRLSRARQGQGESEQPRRRCFLRWTTMRCSRSACPPTGWPTCARRPKTASSR